jgi:hypothetical protein
MLPLACHAATKLILSALFIRLATVSMVALLVSFLTVFAGFVAAPSVNDFDGQVTGISLQTFISNLYPRETFQLKQELSFLLPCFVGIYSGTNNAGTFYLRVNCYIFECQRQYS